MSWLKGSDVLGAAGSRSVLIEIPDVPGLVKSQGGAAGAFIQKIVPDTIEAQVFKSMADEIRQGLKDKGIAANVNVVSPVGYKKAVGGDFFRGALAGAAALMLGTWGWKKFKR